MINASTDALISEFLFYISVILTDGQCSSLVYRDATTKARILHRDASSVGNIIIVRERGILIDLELCNRIDQKVRGPYEKKTVKFVFCLLLPHGLILSQGIFQFISARILMNQIQEHKVGNDLESFAHVLTRQAAIKYFQNKLATHEQARLLKMTLAVIRPCCSRSTQSPSKTLVCIRNHSPRKLHKHLNFMLGLDIGICQSVTEH